MDYLGHVTITQMIDEYARWFQGMDLLFYGFAVFEAYKFAFKYKVRRKAAPPP